MANTFVNASAVSKEFLRVLRSHLPFTNSIDRYYDNNTKIGSVKHGGTIAIRKPTEFNIRTGSVANVQNATATSDNLTTATQFGVDCAITSQQAELNLDSLSKEVIAPAAARMAAYLESQAMASMYKDVYNTVGTVGTSPASSLVWLQAGAKLDENLAPYENRCAVINPTAQASTVAALTSLFNPTQKIAKQYESAMMGNALGMDFKLGQLAPTHTTGTRTNTTPLVDGASQVGDSLLFKGTGNAVTYVAGDVFTIAGVYSVNQDKQSTGNLKQFVVKALATSAAGGGLTVTISPSIVTSGATQTVTASPADGAAVVNIGATASGVQPQSLVFQKDAFTLATVDLPMPKGLDFASREVLDGISMRVLGDYDIINDQTIYRFDILTGWLAQRPELACRVVA